MTKTLRIQLRLKDKHACVLRQMAREVNQVWNHINEVSARAARPFSGQPRYLSGYDLQKLTAGFSQCDGIAIGSGTVQVVCAEYATRRRPFKRSRLNWRVSNPKSSKYSLGWIPFKIGHARYKAGQIQFAGQHFSLWDSHGLADHELRSGSFSEDSRGRWYLNVAVEIPELVGPRLPTPTSVIGIDIDLGLKDCATTSAGQKLEGRWYRAHEQKLATAQRARKKRRKALHAQIRNQRQDALHQFSTALVKEHAAIFVGDVASAKLVKTQMAKSTLDAGWAMFKTMLEYKSRQAGVVFEVVNEAYSTQTCSCCGAIPASSPKGRAGLGIREWACSACATVHDRDVNAARNILAAGHGRLAGGIPVL
ncbi:transposase [Malikia sp.]|uniref:RNA-guided endonuclease InsQ/TnpB family protein n=1 Tax=Malikia sp. TaxID=2070706 RepID=UPI002628AE30|nr:transposase [Malikia sp.]MDD2728658.1 transposase [Malikia sp.]